MGVGVEDFFSVVMILALLLLAILWCLIQCCGELGRLNSSGCSCVLVFLVPYPVKPVDGYGLGFASEKLIFGAPLLSLVDSLVWHTL